jgi:tetratricopeptide (TPR) repeat protein
MKCLQKPGTKGHDGDMVDGARVGGYGLIPSPEGRNTPVWPVRAGAVPPVADGFTLRLETVPDLDAALVQGVMVALVPAGPRDWPATAGKTQLAVSCAETLWRGRTIDLLIWVNASSRASALSGYLRGAAAIGANPDADAEAAVAHLIAWLATTTRPWLVVLDDVCSATDLEGLWPDGPAGRLIATTSDIGTIPRDRHAVALKVPSFSAREATAFIAGRLVSNPDQRNGTLDLVYDLNSEPLALGHACAVIASSGLSCRDYREYYAEWKAGLAPNGGPAVAVTWALSAAFAERLMPGSREVLGVAAFLDGRAIPGNVFTTLAVSRFLTGENAFQSPDPERTWNCVRALEQAGLLSVDPTTTPPTVRAAQPVQEAARAQLSPELYERALRAAADALLEVWPKEEPQSAVAADMRSCVAALWRTSGDGLWAGGRCHPVLMLAGHSLDGAQMPALATSFWRELIAVCERVLGPASADTITVAARLADALLAAGQAGEAVTWYKWVLTGRISVLGPDHPGTIAAKATMGRAMVAAERPAEAVATLSDTVADFERVRGADHLDTLAARDECAAACVAAGNLAMGIDMYRRSLADRGRVQGARHPDVQFISMRLAHAYQANGQFKDAISLTKRVLADREQALGPDHPDTLGVKRRLADVYNASGKIGNAVQLYEQALAGLTRVLGPDHRDTLACQGELARLYYFTGRVGDAVTSLTEGIAHGEQALPPGDAVTEALRRALAEITG